jgi:hypothetical protein
LGVGEDTIKTSSSLGGSRVGVVCRWTLPRTGDLTRVFDDERWDGSSSSVSGSGNADLGLLRGLERRSGNIAASASCRSFTSSCLSVRSSDAVTPPRIGEDVSTA